jgi:hypothetical protein
VVASLFYSQWYLLSVINYIVAVGYQAGGGAIYLRMSDYVGAREEMKVFAYFVCSFFSLKLGQCFILNLSPNTPQRFNPALRIKQDYYNFFFTGNSVVCLRFIPRKIQQSPLLIFLYVLFI